LYLLVGQASSLTGAEAANADAADPCPHQFADGMSEACQHPADLPVTAIPERDAQRRARPSALDNVHLGGPRPSLGQVDTADHAADVGGRDASPDGGQIRLRHAVSRMGQAIGKLAVVRHKEQTLGRYARREATPARARSF